MLHDVSVFSCVAIMFVLGLFCTNVNIVDVLSIVVIFCFLSWLLHVVW